ncbi:MAG TPA: HAD family phosphatase [Usitatibacter sp.]|nr:HAD family phosphatase [Usitatibacter sp.]
MSEVDALLFDLGGVVIELDWARAFERWAAASGERADTLRERFSFDLPYERHERGEISASQYYASLRASLRIDIPDRQFAEGWESIFAAEVIATVRLLNALKDRVPLYAFSNTNLAHYRVWSQRYARALSVFRKVFVSCEMGKRKPERAAFEEIARDIGVPMERILFFDDSGENIAGARAAGLRAVQVRSAHDVERALLSVV